MTALNPPQAASGQRAARVSEAEPEPGPQPHAPARSAGWRPWHGRPRARDLACALAIAVSAVYALAMIPLTPALIATRPVLLEMLSGSNSAIVAAGAFSDIDSKLQLAVVVSAALPGMLRFDWVIWWAGRLWGHRIVAKLGAHSPRTAAMAAAAERRGTRFAGPAVLFSAFLPISGAPVYAAAGWVGLPLIPFMILDAIGCAAWAALLGTAGYLLGPAGVRVADLVSRYALATVGVLVLLAVAPHAWHAWRSRARARCAALRAAAETSLTERADALATDVRLLPEGADG